MLPFIDLCGMRSSAVSFSTNVHTVHAFKRGFDMSCSMRGQVWSSVSQAIRKPLSLDGVVETADLHCRPGLGVAMLKQCYAQWLGMAQEIFHPKLCSSYAMLSKPKKSVPSCTSCAAPGSLEMANLAVRNVDTELAEATRHAYQQAMAGSCW